MRYSTPIYFVTEGERVRLPNGQYEVTEPTKTDAYFAHVSNVGDEKKQLVYGNVTQDAIIARFQHKPEEITDTFEFNGIKYVVDRTKQLRNDFVIYGSEANG